MCKKRYNTKIKAGVELKRRISCILTTTAVRSLLRGDYRLRITALQIQKSYNIPVGARYVQSNLAIISLKKHLN